MKKPFDRVITVMFENQYRNYVISNPFLKKLATAGADMTNYFGVFHPSQTNYIASLAGEVCGITNDTVPTTPLTQETLVDSLENKNISWKAYMEAYPSDPWKAIWQSPKYPASKAPIDQYPPAGDENLSRYFRKHNAFASFHNIQKDENKWNKIVSDTVFWQDVANDSLPEYSWFTPDIWNDGHYLYNTHIDTNPRTQLVPQLSAWLEHVFLGNIATSDIQGGTLTGLDNIGLNLDVDLLLTNPKEAWRKSNVPEGTLIVITFDEADFNADGYDTNYDGPNQIYTVLLGDMIEPGTVINTPYNHYSLIRTIQKNYQLDSLNKNDYGANWFRFLWKESFNWGKKIATDFLAGNTLSITHSSIGQHLVFSNKEGELFDSILSNKTWSTPTSLNICTKREIALTTIGHKTILIFIANDGTLMQKEFDTTTTEWSQAISLGQKTSLGVAITTFKDMVDFSDKTILCWVSNDGFIQSMIGNIDGFSNNVIPVNQLTDGPICIEQLGASLFLVYKERNTRKMRMTSYNTAPFNRIQAVNFENDPAPENNTSLHQWSITDYTVGHFSKKMGALTDAYQNIGKMTMATLSGEMHLIHGGAYADLSNAYTEILGLNGIYTASHQLSNGFGTLHQAGWTRESKMKEINITSNNPIAICASEHEFTLVWVDATSNKILYKQGAYH